MNKKIKIYFLVSVMLSGLSLASPALADDWVEDILGEPLIPEDCTKSRTNDDAAEEQVDKCGLNEILETVVNFSKLLLALTGSAALLMFTYGGAIFILAAGKQEWIQKGKAAMTAAAIGIIIILGAYLVVNFTILALTSGEVGGDATIFGNPFNEPQPVD